MAGGARRRFVSSLGGQETSQSTKHQGRARTTLLSANTYVVLTVCWVLHVSSHLILEYLYEAGTVVIPILHIRQLRHREIG